MKKQRTFIPHLMGMQQQQVMRKEEKVGALLKALRSAGLGPERCCVVLGLAGGAPKRRGDAGGAGQPGARTSSTSHRDSTLLVAAPCFVG